MATRIVKATLHDGAETVSGTGVGQNCKARTGAVYLDVTVGSSPDTLDVTVEEQDQVTGQWYVVATFATATVATTEKVAITAFFGGNLRAVWAVSASPAAFTFTVGFAGKD